MPDAHAWHRGFTRGHPSRHGSCTIPRIMMRRAGYLLPFLTACSGFHVSATPDAGFVPVNFDAGRVDGDAGAADAAHDQAAAPPFTVVQQLPDAGAFHSVWGSGPSDIHAVGDNGLMYDYDGTGWTSVLGQTGASMGGVWGTSSTDIYAVGTLAAAGRGIIFHNDGTGWVEQMEEPVGLNAVWGASGTVYAVGLGGQPGIARLTGSSALVGPRQA